MKKKIKDLTLEEVNKICYKNSICSGCPLMKADKSALCFCYKDIVTDLTKFNLESEVEVNE